MRWASQRCVRKFILKIHSPLPARVAPGSNPGSDTFFACPIYLFIWRRVLRGVASFFEVAFEGNGEDGEDDGRADGEFPLEWWRDGAFPWGWLISKFNAKRIQDAWVFLAFKLTDIVNMDVRFFIKRRASILLISSWISATKEIRIMKCFPVHIKITITYRDGLQHLTGLDRLHGYKSLRRPIYVKYWSRS